MSDIEVVKLNAAEKKVFISLGIFILLVSFIYINRYWLRLGHDYRDYARADLLVAQEYVNGLPNSAAPMLFSSNWRSIGTYGQKEIAQRGISRFRQTQAATYPPLQGSSISVIVHPGFLAASTIERSEILEKLGVYWEVARPLASAPNDRSGCIAAKFEDLGWTRGGYVLADPFESLESEPDVVGCIEAGLSYVNGLPIYGETFSLSEMPSAPIAAIVLDYTMRCAYDGISDEAKPDRSGSDITSKPAISCIRNEVAAALGATRP